MLMIRSNLKHLIFFNKILMSLAISLLMEALVIQSNLKHAPNQYVSYIQTEWMYVGMKSPFVFVYEERWSGRTATSKEMQVGIAHITTMTKDSCVFFPTAFVL